ncbi:MAG: D-aminoacyl-tRNA deacylase [Chlamydiota bacterium]|nr:D-aminoacyl-tRNA deacylase [Chlamydiota bacterium]
MRILIQRVKEAKVHVDGEVVGQIDQGILVFLGVHKDDKPADTEWLVKKLVGLRIFEDEQGKMNRNVQDIKGEILVVSQFTLYGNCMNGRRPDFISSMRGDAAEKIYDKFAAEVKQVLGRVETGQFGAMMQVELTNDGPVTFLIDGKT